MSDNWNPELPSRMATIFSVRNAYFILSEITHVEKPGKRESLFFRWAIISVMSRIEAPQSYAGVLTPDTHECDIIWK